MEDSVAKQGETLDEERKKVMHDLIRWLVFVPLIFFMLLTCGQVAGLGLNTPVGETKSKIFVDYAVWATQPYHPPLAAAIIDEIRRAENLPTELVVTGSYWPTMTPRPGAAIPTATEVALQPSPSPTPSKSATFLPQSTGISRSSTPEEPYLPATRTSTTTPTSSATASPTPTFTRTYIPAPLWTRTPTQEPPDTAIPSATPSGTPTLTIQPILTATPTNTPTANPTAAPTSTETLTPLSSHTPTSSPTRTPTTAATSSLTPTLTHTSSPSQTPTQTSTPTNTSPPIQSATPTPTATRVAISGILEGTVVANPDNSCTAYWGYDNPNAYSVVIDIGPANQFAPLPADRGQPILFAIGRQTAVYQTTWFGGGNLVWTLDGGSATAGWCQSSPTETPTPTPTTIPAPPGINIGPGDGQILDIGCGNSVILDLGAPYPIGSMVFYEYENPPGAQQIFLDWIYLSVSNDAAGPWANVFYWGDSNNGNNGYLPQYPPAPIPGQHFPPETDNEIFDFSELYLGSTTGIQIPVYGTYRYILIGAPPGCGDVAQIDSVQFVP